MAPKMAEADQVSFKSMMAGLVRSEWCNIKKMVFRVFEVYALFRWFQVISVSLHVHVRVKCEYKQSDSVFILHTNCSVHNSLVVCIFSLSSVGVNSLRKIRRSVQKVPSSFCFTLQHMATVPTCYLMANITFSKTQVTAGKVSLCACVIC